MNRPAIYLCTIFTTLTLACGKVSSPTQSRQSPEQALGLPAAKAVAVTSESLQTAEERLAAVASPGSIDGSGPVVQPKHQGSNHPPTMNQPNSNANRLRFVDLPENVSTESPASSEVILEDSPSRPTIVNLRITSTPLHWRWYDQGEIIEIEVEFSERVEVMSTIRPYIWLRVDFPSNRMARYSHGTGTKRLFFRYTVNLNDLDTNGIGVKGGEIQDSDGAITAVSSGVPASVHHNGLPEDPNHSIDGCL